MQHSATRMLALLGLAGAVALTGCGSSSKSSSGGGLGAGTSSARAAPAARAAPTYKIGFEGPLSGDNQQLGINEVNAVKLAIDQANAERQPRLQARAGQVRRQGDPAKAPAAAAALHPGHRRRRRRSARASPVPTKAVGKTYGAAGLAMISPSATNATLTTLGLHDLPPHRPAGQRRGHAGRRLAGQARAQERLRRRRPERLRQGRRRRRRRPSSRPRASSRPPGCRRQDDRLQRDRPDRSSPPVPRRCSTAATTPGRRCSPRRCKAAGYNGLRSPATVASRRSSPRAPARPVTAGTSPAAASTPRRRPTRRRSPRPTQAKFNTPPSTYSPEAYDATNAMIHGDQDGRGQLAP